MDILYVVGRGSTWNNNELKYSLRSIAKNGINVDRVFIVGYIPDFINREEVICLPFEDKMFVKHYNIVNAVDYAVKNSDIGINNDGEFLYSSDDHFYIRKTDFNNYPVYWIGKTLPSEVKPEDKHPLYRRTLVSTREVLEEFGCPYYHLAWHGNTHFNANLWKTDKFQNMIQRSYTKPEGCDPTCLILNYKLSIDPFEFIERKDQKAKKFISREEFFSKIEDRECFSCAPNVNGSYVPIYLQETFSDKCKYEI